MRREPNYTAHVPWLEGKGRNDYSQFGEDGLIESCIDYLGGEGLSRPNERFCFEVGAGDGRTLSNTLRLRERGWSAVLIESSDLHYQELEQFADDKVKTIHALATPDNFNQLLSVLPHDCDVGSIDIDGQDYWLFKSMAIRPRVMVVEYNPYVPVNHIPGMGEPNNATDKDGTGIFNQATLEPIVELGKSKGYQFVAQTYCNVVFVYGSES